MSPASSGTEPDDGERPPRLLAVLHPEFTDDLRYWVEADRRIALRLLAIVEATLRDSFEGIGQPEPLKFLPEGTWSRRLNQEHRIVYRIRLDRIEFVQARFHYR